MPRANAVLQRVLDRLNSAEAIREREREFTRRQRIEAVERAAAEADARKEANRKANRPKCGARTRKGAPCRAPAVWDSKKVEPVNGRCRMHGGLSTGPKSAAGRARALRNLVQYRDREPVEARP